MADLMTYDPHLSSQVTQLHDVVDSALHETPRLAEVVGAVLEHEQLTALVDSGHRHPLAVPVQLQHGEVAGMSQGKRMGTWDDLREEIGMVQGRGWDDSRKRLG